VQKTQDAANATVGRLQGGGTIAQPGYDAPRHKIQFDGLIFTDSLTTIQNGGYLQDPQGNMPAPLSLAPPTGLKILGQ
jgi:hypothetical protein